MLLVPEVGCAVMPVNDRSDMSYWLIVDAVGSQIMALVREVASPHMSPVAEKPMPNLRSGVSIASSTNQEDMRQRCDEGNTQKQNSARHVKASQYHATPVSTAWKSSRLPTTFQFNTKLLVSFTVFAYDTWGMRATGAEVMTFGVGVDELNAFVKPMAYTTYVLPVNEI